MAFINVFKLAYSGLNYATPPKQSYVHTLISETCECDLIWKNGLCWYKLSITRGDHHGLPGELPKVNGKCPWKRQKRRTGRRDGYTQMEVKTGVISPCAKERR